MNQQILNGKSQIQDNLVKDANVGRDLTFAPVQIGTKIETQIIQTSVTEVTQQPLIKTSPYQGLKRFNLQDRDRFFGRDQLIARLFEAVNRSNLSLVLGASGSGKSSVVRAGLIPQLKKSLESSKFYDFIFTPNDDPFESLYRCLLSEEKDYNFKKSEVKIARKAEADTLTEVISTLKKEDERWMIFVDQFEELFTSCQDLDRRNNFIASLVRVANSKDNSVKIILAMRADFLEQLSSYPDLGAIINEKNIHLVTDMHPDELRQAIEQPAAKQGVVFEEGLVEQIIKEVEGQKGYLPLLQYTLNLLWQTECRTIGADGRPHIEDRTLNKTSYAALEGVRGALQKRVNEIYHSLNQEEQSATKQIFVKLVNIVDTDSGNKAVSRRANRSEFVGESVTNTLKTFIDENLLVSSSEDLSSEKLQVSDSENSQQSATVEIAHEILLSSWDRLKGWIEAEKEAIILKNWLAGETRRWQKICSEDESKGREELLKGSRLEQVVEFRNKDTFKNLGGLRAEENEFIDVSVAETERLEKEKEARRRRDLRTAWGIAAGSLLAVIMSTGLWLRAEEQQKQAELNQADSLARSSLSLFNEGKELDAFVEVIRAVKILQKHQETDPEVISALQEALYEVRERNRLQGHDEGVRSISFSPDGQTLATASDDNTIKLWNLETGEEIRTLQEQDEEVRSVSFSPDGQTIASASGNTIQLWSRTGTLLKTITGYNRPVLSVNFSPDGQMLAASSEDGTIQFWNLNGTSLAKLYEGNVVYQVKFSPDGQTIASVGGDTMVKLWNLDGTLLQMFKGHQDGVYDISFSPNGQTIASASADGTIRVWQRHGISLQRFYAHRGNVYDATFSPDGQLMASGGADNVVKLSRADGTPLKTLEGHTGLIHSVAFSPDNQMLASASWDGTVKLWTRDGTLIDTLKGHTGRVYGVMFSPDGEMLVTSSGDGTIKTWGRDGNLLKTLRGHTDVVHNVSFSPNGKLMVSASHDKTVRLWSRDGLMIEILQGHTNWVHAVAFSPDGQTIASASHDRTVKLWNLDGTLRDTLSGHTDKVKSVTFSPDGQMVASSSEDRTLRLWRTDGTPIAILRGHGDTIHGLNFSPDGNTLSSASNDNTVILWNLENLNDLEGLLAKSCNWLRGYLQNNSTIQEGDKHLCDGI